MLYNKNQFRKTNDKKVLHKIGKHWVTVSVAFLSLLGLGAVSTTATTHADTTDNANAQTTSAAPNSNSADSIQKQVTKQANALHNQLLGHAAVSQKPAQQGTARLGSVNGRVNQAQTQNAQQNKKPANNQMSANHSNAMRLGANQKGTASHPNENGNPTDPTKPLSDVRSQVRQLGKPGSYLTYDGLTYKIYVDATPSEKWTTIKPSTSKTTTTDVGFSDPNIQSWSDSDGLSKKTNAINKQNDIRTMNRDLKEWLNTSHKSRFPKKMGRKSLYKLNWQNYNEYLQYEYDKQNHKQNNFSQKFINYYEPRYNYLLGKYFNINLAQDSLDSAAITTTTTTPSVSDYVPTEYNYRLEITGNDPSTNGKKIDLSNFLTKIAVKNRTHKGLPVISDSDGSSTIVGSNFVSVQIDKGVNTSNVTNMSNMFSNDQSLRTISGLSNLNTSNVTKMVNMFQNDSSLTHIKGVSDWDTSKVSDMGSMFSGDTSLQDITDMSHWNLNNINTKSDGNPSDNVGLQQMFYSDNKLNSDVINQINHWLFTVTSGHGNDNDNNDTTFAFTMFGGLSNPIPASRYVKTGGDSDATPFTKKYTNKEGQQQKNNAGQLLYTFDLKPYIPVLRHYHFQGMEFNYDPDSGTVTFTNGTYKPTELPTITDERTRGYNAVPYNDTFSGIAEYYGVSDYKKYTNKTKAPESDVAANEIYYATNIKFNKGINLNNVTLNNSNAATEYKGMFLGMPNLQSVDMHNIQTPTKAWNMQFMFAKDPNLVSVSFPQHMDLTDVDNISYLFGGDVKLRKIDFGDGFNHIGNDKGFSYYMTKNGHPDKGYHHTSDVNMDGVFYDTKKLSLESSDHSWIRYDGNTYQDYTDPSDFLDSDSAKASFMTHAFDKFDTSHAISMNHMFSDTDISALRVPFDTRHVTSMNHMFSNNYSDVTSLSFGPLFITKNVTSMQGMFMNDHFKGLGRAYGAITDLNFNKLGGQFDTSKVTNMKDMFAGDFYLTGLELPASFNTQKVTDMSNMFAGLGSHYNTSASTNGIGAQYNKVDLTLPINFYIPKNGSANMFGGWQDPTSPAYKATAGIHSLTLTSNNKPVLGPNGKPVLASDKKTELFHTNTVFSDKPTSATTSSSLISPTKIVPLYEQEPTNQYGDGTLITNLNDGNDYSGDKRMYNPKTKTYDYYMPYTLNSPHDFTSGIAGTYMPKNSIPEKLAFSDVFSNNDSYTQHGSHYLNDQGLDWRLSKDKEGNPIVHNWSQAPSGWVFVTPSDSFSLNSSDAAFHKNPTTGSDRVLVAPLYHGLVLRYNASDKTAEFVAGPITTSDTMANFDNINAPHPYNNDDTYGEQTINSDVKNASTIKFDMVPHNGLPTIHGVSIVSDPDMSYMFANPNLKHLIFDNEPNNHEWPTFDTSKTTNMEGMFQGANISDLTLPSDFDTTNVTNMTNMFAEGNNGQKATNGEDGQPSSSLKSLTITSPDTIFSNNSDTKMPTLYRVLNEKDSSGKNYTDNDWTKFGSLNSKNAVGTYVASPDYTPVSDTINFDLIKSNGQKVTIGTKKTGLVPAGDSYKVYNKDVPSGYQFAPNANRTIKLSNVTNSTYSVPVKPIHESDTVTFMYKPNNEQSYTIGQVYSPREDSDDFSGNDYADRQDVSDTSKTFDNSSEYVPSGWQLDKTKYPSNSVTVPYDGGSHTVYLTPVQVKQTFYYRDENQGDGANYGRIVGSSAVSGNSYAASQAGDNSLIVTKSNHSGLSAGYHLIYPSDDTADNTVEYTGVSDIYIPVELDNGTESIHFQYSGSDVNTSAASFKGQPAGQISVASGMASGYHLASGASTTVPEDNEAHNVSVTPNTITENISYAVQDNPQYATQGEKFSGFSSAIDDSRTKGKHKSFVLNSNNQNNNAMNLPNGFQVSGSYKFGPATTNIANSNSDHTVIVTPDHVHLSVDYFNDTSDAQHYINGSDNHIIASSEYSGLVGNHISIPLNVPKGYSMITPYGQHGSVYDVTNSDELSDMPTKFSPAPSDHVYIYVRPETATSRIQFVDASHDNSNVGNPISVSGQSVNVPGTYNTGFDITETSNTNYIPKGYVLVNQDNPVKYDNQTYTIPVVPANNNLAIDYQYNGQSVHSTMVHRTSPTATIKINSDYEPGLPAGYRLSDEHNVSDDNVFDDTKTSGNIAVVPLQQTDTINYQLNGKTIGVGHVSGNDARATYANGQPVSDTMVNVTNQTDGVPSGYHVVQNNETLNVFGFDGQQHNVVVQSNNTKETIEYMYKGVSRGSDQFFSAPGEKIDITSANATDMPSGYHLVNANNQFTANNGDHQIEIAPSTSTFTVNFVNNGKTVGTKQYTGATDTSFTVDGAADTPKGYTINKGQNMNYDFDGDETKDVANLNVTPIPPTMDTESINFIYSDANHQNHNEGSTVHTGVKGSVGTVTSSDYSALKSGWQIIPGENNSNKFFNYKFSDGSVNMFVEPIQQTEKVWFLNDQTGKLIGNDGPFSDTVVVTGNDYRAKDAGNNSFVIGATPNHLNLSYYKVDDPEQVIPFDGYNHGVNVHLVKEAPYSAKASQAAAAKQAAATASINAAKSEIAKKTNQSTADSYAKSATSAAASQIPSQAANSVASTNDNSEYNHEQSANSSIASSASSSAAQSQSSKNNSLNSSIAGKTSSESAAKSASSTPSSSAASVMPYIPFVPSSAPSSVSSSASSVASRSTEPASQSAAPVTMTNKNYPIIYAKSANKPDMVTVMGRQYPVHYHANGKNTVRVRERITKNGKRSYRYKNVVVSTDVPTIKPSSDEIVREIDHIDFSKVNKHVWSAKGLDKVLNSIKPGEVVTYRGHTMARLNAFNHFRYFMITREALAHKIITNIGIREDQNLLKALKTHHAITIHITNIVVVHNKHANKIRYEFNFHHHNFWVTGRNDYTPNAYWQESELHSHRTRMIRVLRGCVLYTSPYFSHKHAIKGLHAGDVLHVKKAFFIGRHGAETEQTRFELTNHDIVTSNKNYVQLVRGRRARY